MLKTLRWAAPAVMLIMSGCAQEGGGPLGFVLFDENHTVAAAEPLFGKDEDQCLDSPGFLMSLYRPDAPEQRTEGAPGGKSGSPSRDPNHPACARLREMIRSSMALGSFWNPVADDKPYSQRQRNEVIDALLAASNRKCGRYTAFLQQYDANVNSTFGILAQAAAILATVSSGGTAQGFAALSGISSGTRGTLNEAHFANQTIGVLANAFEISRTQQRQEIVRLQQCPAEQYTLMRGLEDALRYHSSCSIVVGLKEAARAVEQSRAPNLDSFNKMLDQLAEAQGKMRKLTPPKDEEDDNGSSEDAGDGGGTADEGAEEGTGGENAGGDENGEGQDAQTPPAEPAGGGGNGDRGAAPSCPFDTRT